MSEPLTIINDPIYQMMVLKDKNERNEKELRDMFLQLCDHPYFQRLRRIKQLGCADLVLPGAVHTRFNHYIGVCYLTNRIADNLNLEFNDKKILMISGLLHDRHGPFSHAFENLYHSGNVIKHDNQWLSKFLIEYNVKFLNNNFIENIKCLISSGVDNTSIPNNLILLRDIISSNPDADRLDYLLRDSHFCGVPYGNIDLEWILSCFFKIEISSNTHRLGINRKGIGAIEDFLCARRLMTKNIYYHSKVKSTEYYLSYFLKDLSKHLMEDEKKSIIKFRY